MKEKKTPTTKDRSPKPLVQISTSAEQEKRSFTLSKTTWEVLDRYVDFLGKYYNGKVTAEQVLEARIEDLQRDRAWLASQRKSNTSNEL